MLDEGGRTLSPGPRHVQPAQASVAGLIPGRDYLYWEAAGGQHNEAAWAARFDKLLLYFFGR